MTSLCKWFHPCFLQHERRTFVVQGGPGDIRAVSLVSGDATAGASSRPALQGGAVAFGLHGCLVVATWPRVTRKVQINHCHQSRRSWRHKHVQWGPGANMFSFIYTDRKTSCCIWFVSCTHVDTTIARVACTFASTFRES